jgi:hypothetical protein
MKITKILTAAALAASLSTAASAQTVIASFDNLVDEVLGTVEQVNTNAAFYSGAVNIADIDGSIDITAGSVLPAGTLDVAAAAGTLDSSSDPMAGSTTNIDAEILLVSAEVEELTTEFGAISSVAAGAISSSDINLTENGSIASSGVNTTGSLTSFIGSASNTTGSTIGVVQTALNTGFIDGSINMTLQNVSGGAESIASVAAGAINTGDVTAIFVGGGEATASVSP